MEAPKRIVIGPWPTIWNSPDREGVEYIRSDLVNKLIAEYSGHKGSCVFWDEGYDESDCTCGYFRLIQDLTLTN